MRENDNERNKINELVSDTLQKLKSLADSSTIVGEAICVSEQMIVLPLSKAQVGFVLGGGEYTNIRARKNVVNYPMAGGSGGGINLTPIGFLVINGENVKFISTNMPESPADKVFEMIIKTANHFMEKGANNDKQD